MDAREELTALRRMAELEAKASGQAAPTGGIPVGRQGVDQFGIPGTIKPAEPEAPRSLGQRIMGNIETIPALAAGAVGGVVTPIAQLGHELTQGQAFTPQGKAAAAQFGQQVQSQFYQPRTPEAQRNVQAIGEAVVPLAGLHIGGPVNALAPATRAISDAARAEGSLIKGAVGQQLATRAAKTQAANVAASYANAPMIEGTQAAHRLGAAVNPAISNPTISNRARGAIAGPAVIEEKLAKNNAVAVTNKVREDLGVPANKPLDASAIETALDNASKPNDVVRKMARLVPDANVIQSIEALRKPTSAVAKGKIEASNALINNMLEEIKQGRSGADVLNDIRQLRAEANNVYKRRDKGLNVPTAAEIAEANTRSGIAKAYEQLIDANVKDPNVLGDIKLARIRQAQIFDHERALDYGQQKVDPQAYAKMYEERQGKNMTGVGQDIALAASTHPSVFTLTPAVEGRLPRFSRAGLGGLIGGTVGSVAGPVGAAAGLAAGTGIGSVAGGLSAKRMGTPAYQAARAVPKDYRPAPVNAVQPSNALITTPPEVFGPSGAQGANKLRIVSYDANGVPIYMADEPGQGFTMPPSPSFGAAPSPYAQRALPNEIPQQIYRAQKNAELAQEFRAAAERKPAGRGTPLVFDAAGNLVEAPPAGVGSVVGAPTSLESAVKKLSGIVVPETQTTYKTQTISPKTGTKPYTRITKKEGETTFERGVSQAFDLTSEERIAWNKSKADLAAASPEIRGLTDKAIANKLMDQQWIADTIQKVKDKALANEQIAARASTAKAIREAAIEREQLSGSLEMLEEQYRKARPVQKGGQGPKTRAFQRNMLTPEQEIQNALVK